MNLFILVTDTDSGQKTSLFTTRETAEQYRAVLLRSAWDEFYPCGPAWPGPDQGAIALSATVGYLDSHTIHEHQIDLSSWLRAYEPTKPFQPDDNPAAVMLKVLTTIEGLWLEDFDGPDDARLNLDFADCWRDTRAAIVFAEAKLFPTEPA